MHSHPLLAPDGQFFYVYFQEVPRIGVTTFWAFPDWTVWASATKPKGVTGHCTNGQHAY